MKRFERTTLGALAVLAGALSLGGCTAHKRLEPQALHEINRVAVVARVRCPGPSVKAARVDPREGRAYPNLTAAEADAALERSILRQVRRFELEERVRAAVMSKLPPGPPWSTALPAIEVNTALQSLLVEDLTQEVDLDALAKRGADSVLLVEISDYGVRTNEGKTGLYLKGKGTLLTTEGATLWRKPLEIDESVMPTAEPVDVVWLKEDGFRDALLGLLNELGDQVGQELAGR